MTLTIYHENITGASLSGTDGTANRTYTVANTGAISQGMIVNVQGSVLQQTNDFTYSNDTITFLNVVFDDMTITLDYYTNDTVITIASGYGYITTNDVYRTAGITSDQISTADVTQQILEAEKYVCRLTKNVYYKTNLDDQTIASSTNDTITVTGAGWTTNDYANQYVYIKSGTGIGQYRKITSNTSDTITVDRDWTTNPDAADTFKVFYTPSDLSPYIDATGDDAYDGNNMRYFYTPYYPVNKIEEITINDVSVTPSNVYLWKNSGKLQLKPGAEAALFTATYPQQVEIKYWYGVTNLPYEVKRAMEINAAMQILVQQMGGTFDDPATIALPDLSLSIGQAYINIEGTMRRLQEEYKGLMKVLKIYPVFSY